MAERRITGRVNKPGRGRGLAIPDFTSAEQTVTADTLLDVAHGLGVVPPLWQIVLRCTTADLNYAQNDEVVINASNASVDRGITFSVDATNMTVVQGQAIEIHDQSSFNIAAITVTSWRYIMKAWL